MSFLALLASTLSLDAPRPAVQCFSALASRGCLPLDASALIPCGPMSKDAPAPPGTKALPAPSSTEVAAVAASSSLSASASSVSREPWAPVSTDALRINMNALVFPQLMFEVQTP